jgi:hypothetical protein
LTARAIRSSLGRDGFGVADDLHDTANRPGAGLRRANRQSAPGAAEDRCYRTAWPAPDADRVLDAETIKKLRLDRGPGCGPVDAPVTITMFTDLQSF